MSHRSEYKIKCNNISLLKKAIKNQKIVLNQFGEKINGSFLFRDIQKGEVVKQFGRNEIQGAVFAFTPWGWEYEIAVMPDGTLLYDHFGSSPNSFVNFTEIIKSYNCELVEENLNRQGVVWWKSTNPKTQETEYEVEVN